MSNKKGGYWGGGGGGHIPGDLVGLDPWIKISSIFTELSEYILQSEHTVASLVKRTCLQSDSFTCSDRTGEITISSIIFRNRNRNHFLNTGFQPFPF